MAAFDKALLTPITPENQEAWKTRVEELRHRVTNIHKEINAEAVGLEERENWLAREVLRLRQESELIEAQKLSLARVDRPVSRIPTDLPR